MVAINILNFNNYQVTITCVNSILKNPPAELWHIYILDNGSSNESCQELKERFKTQGNISVIRQEKNLGFAGGNEELLRINEQAGVKKCIFSNSDIVFLDGSIDKMMAALDQSDAVIVGPKVLSKNGSVMHSSCLKPIRLIDALEIGRFFPQRQLDEDTETGLHQVYKVSGCCFAVNIPRFRQIGAFDTNTFLYNEENILGAQCAASPFKVYIDLNCPIIHEHAASSGKENDFVRTEYIKSTLYYWKEYENKGTFTERAILLAYLIKLFLKNLGKRKVNLRAIYRAGNKYLNELFNKRAS